METVTQYVNMRMGDFEEAIGFDGLEDWCNHHNTPQAEAEIHNAGENKFVQMKFADHKIARKFIEEFG